MPFETSETEKQWRLSRRVGAEMSPKEQALLLSYWTRKKKYAVIASPTTITTARMSACGNSRL